MPDHVLDMRHFQYALASAEHGSFRRAAAMLNVRQSTVSRGVKSLERRVGIEIFERSYTGIKPTFVGERFLAEAALGIDHLDRAIARVNAHKRAERGTLTVAVSIPFAMLVEPFEQLREDCPNVSIELVESTTAAGSILTRQGNVDIAFVANAPNDQTLQSLHLKDEPIVVVLPRSHALSRARALTLEDLREERILLRSDGLGPDIADYLARWATSWGTPLAVEFHGVDQLSLIAMAARGFGVTISVGIDRCTTIEDVIFVPLAGGDVIPLYAVWQEANANPGLERLVEILRRSRSLRA